MMGFVPKSILILINELYYVLQHVTVLIGEPMEFTDTLQEFRKARKSAVSSYVHSYSYILIIYALIVASKGKKAGLELKVQCRNYYCWFGLRSILFNNKSETLFSKQIAFGLCSSFQKKLPEYF